MPILSRQNNKKFILKLLLLLLLLLLYIYIYIYIYIFECKIKSAHRYSIPPVDNVSSRVQIICLK